ncbi:hypothetical protein QR680_000867 [Steinernema hermaphroditum]|uniref:LisH domain-containing protein ARMC9 n=1 Tax=Steinernema hermaphroditum TaxID=289476 RepID=A0AA39GW67_9BILA|nr:hypothetical protein QR680_000867 [Steinernema hermaphroditum]
MQSPAEQKQPIDRDIAVAIHQYLSRFGLKAAAAAFESECEDRNVKVGKRCEPPKASHLGDVKKKLLVHFEKGERERFYKLWNETFGRSNYPSVNVVDFYLQVYFATYPLRKVTPDRGQYKDRLAVLKTFLEEGNGATMSDNPELVQYFALPYVSDPFKHPVFREVLQKKWVKRVVERLMQVMDKHLQTESDSDDEPRLALWMNAYDRSPSTSSLDTTDQNREYRELQDDYYKLIDIASELIDCLEQSVQGKGISAEQFADISVRLMMSNREAERRMQQSAVGPRRSRNQLGPPVTGVQKRNRSLSNRQKPERKPLKRSESAGNLVPTDPKIRPTAEIPKVEIALKEEAKQQQQQQQAAQQQPLPSSNVVVSQLNYTKINNQLIKNPSARCSALLLQALRQQITLAARDRTLNPNDTVKHYATKDVLSLKNRRNSVVAAIFSVTDNGSETKEEMARFLNALASFKIGRTYLLAIGQGKELLYQISLALRTRKLQNHAADHALAALQKLSLRSFVQKELIQAGMIEWLTSLLDAKPGNFSLEYGSALLMNLCLNPVSHSTILRTTDSLVGMLANLIKHDNTQICPYVNGTLYSILSLAKVRMRARELDLETLIKEKLEMADCDEDEIQLPFVLRQLKGELDAEKGKKPPPSADDEDEEGDYAEAEIDSTDSVKPTMTEAFGEQLLLKKFRQSGASPILVDDKLDTLPPGTVPRRPPGSRRQPTSTLSTKKSRQQPVSSAATTSQKVNDGSESRASSMMSHATFVLENDKRKPLLADNGLKSVSQQSLKVAGNGNERKRTKVNTKEIHDASNDDSSDRPSVSEPLPPPPPPPPHPPPKPTPATRIRPPKRSDSEGRQLKDRGLSTASNCKAASTSVLHTLPADSAPVSTNLPKRIPDDANADEYIAAFGSRPKVMRTPDNAMQPTSSQKKSVMMMY